MKITTLVENVSETDLKAVHGLSLLVETNAHTLLFDLGPDKTLFENCQKRGIDLGAVDTAIISHGHDDHGGALKQFLSINNHAKVYVQRQAFDPHYFKMGPAKKFIGLDVSLKNHPQVVLTDGAFTIDDELSLFTVKDKSTCYPTTNDVLHAADGPDNFLHEQNLLIQGDKPVLISGCSHTGIANIMRTAPQTPAVCIGGFHLINPVTKQPVEDALLEELACELSTYDTTFYTCHCTGEYAFEFLKERVPDLHYLSCGQNLTL